MLLVVGQTKPHDLRWCDLSNSITIAFFSESSRELSPAIYLRYGYDDITGSLNDAMPRLTTGRALASAAQFVACYADWDGGATSVEICNVSGAASDSDWDALLASARRSVDAFVDVDTWVLHFDGAETPLQGGRAKNTGDLEREDRWPRYWAWVIVSVQSLFRRRS